MTTSPTVVLAAGPATCWNLAKKLLSFKRVTGIDVTHPGISGVMEISDEKACWKTN